MENQVPVKKTLSDKMMDLVREHGKTSGNIEQEIVAALALVISAHMEVQDVNEMTIEASFSDIETVIIQVHRVKSETGVFKA